MPMAMVKNPIKSVLEVDLLIRRAVSKSWEIQSNLNPPGTGGGNEVDRHVVKEEVKMQVTKLVERALENMENDIQDYNFCEYRPGVPT